jgi:hypothetical protein
VPNLRCPRNGKWTNHFDSASITATERFEHTLGKAMEVGPPARIPANTVVARLARNRDAQALSGTTVRVFCYLFLS